MAEGRRDPKIVVLQAELLASSPERVRIWLEQRASDARPGRWDDTAALEQALLERHNALITLSLARFTSNSDVIKEIMTGPADESKAVRLAALMNEIVGKAAFVGMPALLLRTRVGLEAFLNSLDEEEVVALFSNPTLSDDFLIGFFEQKGPWQAFDDARRFAAIAALQNSPRIQARYRGPYDGYAEYKHGRVFTAAWELASKVPVTVEWAGNLCWLYEKLPSERLENALELAARWVPDPADAERLQAEAKDLERGELGMFARMRKGLARGAIAAASSAAQRRVLGEHSDPAVRAAFYADAALTVDDMKQADKRDPMLSFEQMMWNPGVWRSEAQRQQLHDMAWDPKRDPKSYMDPQNMFNARREAYRQEHPDWFRDEVDEDDEAEVQQSDPEMQPLTSGAFKSAMQEAKDELSAGNEVARATHLAVLKVLKRTGWLGWGVAALLAVVLLIRR